MTHRGKVVLLPPNRVWRTYQGGRVLDMLAQQRAERPALSVVGAGRGISDELGAPTDGHFPEDWVAATTRATNVGRENVVEGPSHVVVGGERRSFSELLAADPGYFLGTAHAQRFGAAPGILVKLLDSAIRLHFQAHPTADFARRFLNSPSGKTEAYHVLATRPEVPAPYIYLGFQRPPSRERLRTMIETQDIAALEACFDRVPVKPGDTFLVPGGVPHALGEGVFLVEIQEPSDWVVRFEFERAGYVLPESARFMGRDLEFCLNVFDLSAWPASRIAAEAACPPRGRRTLGNGSWQDELIGAGQTPCFRVAKTHLHGAVTRSEATPYIGIVTDGAVTLEAGGEIHHLKRYDKFFCPAGLGPLLTLPSPRAAILECYPPAA